MAPHAPAMRLCLLVSLVLGLRLLGVEPSAQDARESRKDTEYADDPQHRWNRLHAAFYQREVETIDEQQRFPMGPDILDPPLGIHPRFLLEEEPFQQCNAVLDEFLAAHGEKDFAAPLKRVLLQRDLWAVFDVLQTEEDEGLRNFGDTPPPFTPAQQERRAILSRKVARVIAALALPRAPLETLPQTYALAVKSGTFRATLAEQAPADYLPADLFAEKSPWLEAAPGGDVSLHTHVVSGRSVFRIFYRPPVDAPGAAKFADWVQQQRQVRAEPEDPSGRKWEALTQSLPVGSQFLLLREVVAVDDQWQLVPTRIVESVQVRVYRAAPGPEAGPKEGADGGAAYHAAAACQLFEEFELDRRRLFRGESGGLKATPAGARRHMGYTALGRLAVNRQGRALTPDAFPRNCFVCHVAGEQRAPGPKVPVIIGSLGQAIGLLPSPWDDTSARVTLQWKAKQKNFQRLREIATTPAGP